MIETKPRINRGNRGQLFRAVSSARCSETFTFTFTAFSFAVPCSYFKTLNPNPAGENIAILDQNCRNTA